MTNKEVTKKRVFLRTFGCQMNARDSEVVQGLLTAEGYQFVEDEQKADVVLFMTCSVRQHAEDKVWSGLGPFEKIKARKQLIVGVIGCMAQNYKQEIFRRAPVVDFVVGTAELSEIPKIIKQVAGARGHRSTSIKNRICRTSMVVRPEEIYHTGFREKDNHAYVVISEGCDNYCSYCVVPYVRGPLRHRPIQEILREINEAVKAGVTHITLLGQNVNSYRCVTKSQGHKVTSIIDFSELLKRVNEIEGLKEFWFMTSHPKDVTVEFLKTMAACDKLRKSLHLPLQAGSDRILKLMNRRYSVKRYSEIVDQYRSLVYNGLISTDLIVGFPSETEEDFNKTLELVNKARFDSAFIFKYSPRPHTQAALLEDSVPLDIKKKRHAKLLEAQKKICHAKKN